MLDWLFKWVESFVKWVWSAIKAVFSAFLELIQDFAVWVFDQILLALAVVINAIPVPAFLANGLGGMFSALDPSILYFIGVLRLPEGLALIGAGVVFRLVRKLITLGQW